MYSFYTKTHIYFTSTNGWAYLCTQTQTYTYTYTHTHIHIHTQHHSYVNVTLESLFPAIPPCPLLPSTRTLFTGISRSIFIIPGVFIFRQLLRPLLSRRVAHNIKYKKISNAVGQHTYTHELLHTCIEWMEELRIARNTQRYTCEFCSMEKHV